MDKLFDRGNEIIGGLTTEVFNGLVSAYNYYCKTGDRYLFDMRLHDLFLSKEDRKAVVCWLMS